jgi:hypothetical protein
VWLGEAHSWYGHRDGTASYTYTLTRGGKEGGLVEQPVAHRKLNKKTDLDDENSDLPQLVVYRASECIACLHVADALNAGVTNMYSMVERDFDWLQFQVHIFDFVIIKLSLSFVYYRSEPTTVHKFRAEYARATPSSSAIQWAP